METLTVFSNSHGIRKVAIYSIWVYVQIYTLADDFYCCNVKKRYLIPVYNPHLIEIILAVNNPPISKGNILLAPCESFLQVLHFVFFSVKESLPKLWPEVFMSLKPAVSLGHFLSSFPLSPFYSNFLYYFNDLICSSAKVTAYRNLYLPLQVVRQT